MKVRIMVYLLNTVGKNLLCVKNAKIQQVKINAEKTLIFIMKYIRNIIIKIKKE